MLCALCVGQHKLKLHFRIFGEVYEIFTGFS